MADPLIAVAVVIDRDDGRTLLVRRAAGVSAAGYWSPVTGKLEPGETLPEAARREALEECGLTVTVGAEVFRCPSVNAPVAFELVFLEARAPGAQRLRLDPSEVAEARWVDRDGALSVSPMFPDTRAFYAERLKSSS